LDPRKVRNYPGSIAPAAPGDWAWDPGAPIPNEAFRLKQMAQDDMETIGAISNVSQPNARGSITSAEGLRIVMESARTLIRPKAMLFEDAMKKLFELVLDYIQIGYSVPRAFKILGEEVSINGIDPNSPVSKAINDVRVGMYDVQIEPDSTLPRSDTERFARAMEMFQQGCNDRQGALKYSGLPDYVEINARMQEKEDEFKTKQDEQAAAASQQQPVPKQPSTSINFKDVPVDGQAQILQQVGVQADPNSLVQNKLMENVPSPRER
jgi:hypothetical protein